MLCQERIVTLEDYIDELEDDLEGYKGAISAISEYADELLCALKDNNVENLADIAEDIRSACNNL